MFLCFLFEHPRDYLNQHLLLFALFSPLLCAPGQMMHTFDWFVPSFSFSFSPTWWARTCLVGLSLSLIPLYLSLAPLNRVTLFSINKRAEPSSLLLCPFSSSYSFSSFIYPLTTHLFLTYYSDSNLNSMMLMFLIPINIILTGENKGVSLDTIIGHWVQWKKEHVYVIPVVWLASVHVTE